MMKHFKNLGLLVAASAVLMATSSAIAGPNRPANPEAADASARVPLRGNISPIVTSKSDLGAVDDSVPTGTLFVLLGRSSSMQRTLDNYVLGLSTPGSENYHKWLGPAGFAAKFGATDQDIAAVTNWLQSQGFSVVKANKAKTAIEFAGTMGNVKSAFKTEIHRFDLGGTAYFANISDPQIPAALAPVVRGVVGLNRVSPGSSMGNNPTTQIQAAKAKPQLTYDGIGGQTLYVVAGDAAVIYDTPNSAMNPAYSGATVDGSGVTIGAIEITNLSSTNLQDFANYRIAYLGNTPVQAATFIPAVVVEGSDPGVVRIGGNSYDADLALAGQVAIGDGEISQALAPGSKTILYVAQTVWQALARAVDDNNVSILLNNNDDCESSLGAAGNAFLNEEYEQAAAQGITVVAATGNWGSGGCSYSIRQQFTSGGFNVNGAASTSWNLAVAGTDFQVLNTQSNFSQYATPSTTSAGIAGTAPYYTTALSYIPEGAWNNSTAVNTTYENNSNASTDVSGALVTGYSAPAGGGGPSSSAVCAGTVSSSTGDCSGTLSGYTKPAWQTSITPSDGVRDLPDIALFSSRGTSGVNSWATCQDSSLNSSEQDCYGSGSGPSYFTPYGGTPAAAAAAAGIFALVEQHEGQRLGLVTPTLYKLFAAVPSVFHDVSTGNNSVPCASGSTNCGSNNYLSGYNAEAGYDFATGLGSLDVAKLVANWNNAVLSQTSVTLAAGTAAASLGTGPISITHGSTVYFDATVNPDTATGNVTLINSSGAQDNGALPMVAVSNGSASFSSPALPGGTYTVQASYAGDANDQPGESNTVSVTVTPEASTLGMTLSSVDPSSGTITNNVTSVPYGMVLDLAVSPYGSAGEGKGTIPTGAVSAASGSTSLGSATISALATSDGGPGTAYITIGNTAVLTGGSDSVTVSYAGDNSYKATTSNLGLTVTKGAVTVVPGISQTGCTTLKSDWSVPATCIAGANVNTDSVGDVPTGNISISFNGTTQNVSLSAGIGLGTSTGVNVVNSIGQTSAIGVTNYVGTYLPTATATYGGDSNYQGGSGTSTTVQGNESVVSEPSGASFALAGSGAISVSPGTPGASNITITPASGFLGQVALACTVSGGTGTDEPTCSIASTATVTSSSPQTVTLTFNTTAAPSAAWKSGKAVIGGATGIIGIGGLFLSCLLIWRTRRRVVQLVAILAVSLFVTAISACGGGGAITGTGGGGGTPAGTYTVTVNGSNPNITYKDGWVSNPITASALVSVTVN